MRLLRQSCFDGIHPKIFNLLGIFVCASDSVLAVALLPYFTIKVHLLPDPVRKSSLNELHRFLERHERSGCEDEMNVISHENKFVYLESLFGSVYANYLKEKIAERIGLED